MLWSLTVFKAVAGQGSITKAAQVLQCVQSNVTTRIKQLENELGVQLFYRRSRGVELTANGKTLLPFANDMEKLIAQATEAMGTGEIPNGQLALGAPAPTATVHLPDFLFRYHTSFPNVELKLTTGTSDRLTQNILDYQLDGAFITGQTSHERLTSVPAFAEFLVAVTPVTMTSLHTITNATLLTLYDGCPYRVILEQWIKTTTIFSAKVQEMRTLEGILSSIAAGTGISILPKAAVERLQWLERVRIHNLPYQFSQLETHFVRRKDAVLTKAMQSLLKELEATTSKH